VDPNTQNPQDPQPPYQPPQYPYQGDPNAQVPPQWGVPAPAQKSGGGLLGSIFRSVLGRIIAVVVIIAVIGGGYLIYDKVANPSHRSEVIFTATDQGSNDGCKITNRVTTVKAGSSVYVMVMWSHRLGSTDNVVEEDFKDGVSLGKLTDFWQPSDYVGYDCTTDAHDYGEDFSEPGTYEIKITVGDEVVADGTLTVTP
jgi:hypothetical protein